MTIVGLIAAKNAAGSVDATVRAVAALRGVDEVWVVDDGSTDTTGEVAAATGAHVVRLEANIGKGGALAAGVVATPHATRYLLADADLGATAAGLQPLLDTFERDQPAMVVGVLPSAGGRGGFGAVRTFAKRGIRRACGLTVEAPLSGQRVIDAEALRRIALAARFGVEVGMTIDVVRGVGSVIERPIDVDHDHRGRTVGGFRHRGRQGRDIAAALLPRVTSARQRVMAVIVGALVVFGALSGLSAITAAPTGHALPRAQHVLLFSIDHLSLDDIGRGDLSALQTLRLEGLTASLNVRTTDTRTRGGSDRPSLAAAYASIGASARVRAAATMAATRALATHDRAPSLPGALGDALRAAGRTTAVVTSTSSSAAGLAVADRRGEEAGAYLGFVTGARVESDAFIVETLTALRSNSVVIADPGDTDRAPLAGPTNESARTIALRNTDEILNALIAHRPPGTVIIVFSPTPPNTQWELTPLFIYGRGIGRGTVESPSTRRESIGVLADLAPTTLSLLGVKPDAAMTGDVLRASSNKVNVAALQRFDVDGAVRARFFLGAAVGYTTAAIAFYLALIAACLLGASKRMRAPLRVGTCILAAFPLAILVTGGVQHWLRFGGESPLFLVAVTAALGAPLAATRHRLAPVYLLALATLVVIVVDVAVTGPLHAASILGYSLQTTGRFYGLPNASFSVYAASLFLVVVAVAGRAPMAQAPARRVAAVCLLALGVGFVAAPWLANDVGGTLTLLPVSVIAGWLLLDRRITRTVIVVAGVGVAVLFVGLIAAEALFGHGTHLGKLAVDNNSSIVNTLIRRDNANLSLLVSQWWGFGCIALALFGIGLLTGWPQRLTDYLPWRSPLRIMAVATLVVSLIGFAVNDSGPVVIVLCEVVLAPTLALMALERRPEPPRRAPAAPPT